MRASRGSAAAGADAHAAFFSPASLDDMQRKSIEVVVAYLRDGQLMNCDNGQYLKGRR